MHTSGDPVLMGFWFYRAPGSGVFLNLGNTMAFTNHKQAVDHFCPQGMGKGECASLGRAMGAEVAILRRAYASGLDTVPATTPRHIAVGASAADAHP